MATVFHKGPFRIVVELGDADPPAADEADISLRFRPQELAGVVGTVVTRDDAIKALYRIEQEIAAHVGFVVPEVRDAIRNEAAKLVPGLTKALGWGRPELEPQEVAKKKK